MKGAYIPLSREDGKRIALGYIHRQAFGASNPLMPMIKYSCFFRHVVSDP